MSFSGIAFSVLMVAVIYFLYRGRKKAQIEFIKSYRFNTIIGNKIREKYPHLNDEQIGLVLRALKDYFYICNKAKRRVVSMPSQVVDVAWHEFILFTRSYKDFCRRALGRFLHHKPAEAMRAPGMAQDGIQRAWRIACAKERINPVTPIRLPLLFAIDSELGIPDGFIYVLNCEDKSSVPAGIGYCAGHIGCASGCAGESGSPSSSGGWFDGFGEDPSGCSGGCGGD